MKPPRDGWDWAAGVMLVAALAAQVLALESEFFRERINSDYLIAEFFARSLADPAHSAAGWTFGGAPFWFPDYALYLPLRAAAGGVGAAYAAYAVAWYLALGATFAWALTAAGAPRRTAILAAGLALNALLALRGLPGHGFWLWLMAVPGFHGGNLLNTLALLALALGAVRAGRWRSGRAAAAFAVLGLGLLSNALLLQHAVLPLGAVLTLGAWRAPERRRVAAEFAGLVALALGTVWVVRWGLDRAGWFWFAELLYERPTPADMVAALGRFIRDARAGMAADTWAFAALLLAGTVVALAGVRRATREVRCAVGSVLLGLALAWLTPLVASVWHSAAFLRYEMNGFVAPAWLLALAAALRWPDARSWARAGTVVGTLALLVALPGIAPARLALTPAPDETALLARCRALGLTEGLCGYWQGHRLATVWQFSGPALMVLEHDGPARFWCNNAVEFFPARPGGGLREPRPQFILLDDLDAAAVAREYGGPLAIEHIGGHALAVLTPAQSVLAGQRVAGRVRERLGGARARWLAGVAGP